VAGLEHEDPALLDDYLAPEGIAFIEWAPVGEPLPARPALELRLDHAGADRRTIEVSCPARRASPRP
jgi:tRNA threonylcarbamoyladenosine biosynthesis protein TsaE